jgi:hypothetical protein
MALHTTDDSLRVRGIFLLLPTSLFLHEIHVGQDPFRQQGVDFSRHIGWEWGKIPTWWEKFWHSGKNSSLEMGLGRNNYDMVGKIPTWLEKFQHGWKKRQGGIHEGLIHQAM